MDWTLLVFLSASELGRISWTPNSFCDFKLLNLTLEFRMTWWLITKVGAKQQGKPLFNRCALLEAYAMKPAPSVKIHGVTLTQFPSAVH